MLEQRLQPCIFLLGLHGAGKTTLGRYMEANHGWRHLSLGDLGRLARSRKLPREYSVRFMGHLASHPPGERLGRALIESMLSEINQHRQSRVMTIDGFPAEPYHMDLLPEGSRVVNLILPEEVRQSRLDQRSQNTARKWTQPERPTGRDQDLPIILERYAARIYPLDAQSTVPQLAQRLLQLATS